MRRYESSFLSQCVSFSFVGLFFLVFLRFGFLFSEFMAFSVFSGFLVRPNIPPFSALFFIYGKVKLAELPLAPGQLLKVR